MTVLFCSYSFIANATEIDTSVEGYTKMLDTMKIYVRGAGGIVLLIGSADFFISLNNQTTERLVRAMQMIGAGFFLILADSFVKAIGSADGEETFQMLVGMVGLVISFIGAVLAIMGSYKCVNSIKERDSEARSKAIKLLFSGLMLIGLSQSLTTFLL